MVLGGGGVRGGSSHPYLGVFLKLTLTNKLNLPRPIVIALENDEYTPGHGDYTATGLLQPARMRRLVQLYPDQCVEDAASMTPILFGKAVHYILEKAAEELEAEGFIVERRFYGDFVVNGKNFVVSAQIDLYDRDQQLLQDYKTSSVWSLSHGLKEEHLYQVSLQAELMLRDGINTTKAQIVGIFKDWSGERADAALEAGDPSRYPQEPATKIDVPLLSSDDVAAWVHLRVTAHEAAKKATTQAELPLCTEEETWVRTEDDEFAVVKPGNQKATKVFGARELAEAYIAEHPNEGYVIEARLGKAVRCNRYCPARRVCEQWKVSPRNPVNRGKSVLVKGEAKTKGRKPKLEVPEGFEVI